MKSFVKLIKNSLIKSPFIYKSLHSQIKPFYFSVIDEYFQEFEYILPFMSTNPSLIRKYDHLMTEIKNKTIKIKNIKELSKLVQIYRRNKTEDSEICKEIANITKQLLEEKNSNIFEFAEILSIFAFEKNQIVPFVKDSFLMVLLNKFNNIEINAYNVNQAAQMAYFILVFEIGYKEFFEILQTPQSDELLDKQVTTLLFKKFTSFQKEIKCLNEKYLVELLQTYYVVLRSFEKNIEYKAFIYALQDKIYKNLKSFTTEQLTILGILYQNNHIIHKHFWEGLEEEVHFRINEWNLSHLMKVCDCFMSVKEGIYI